MALGLSQEFEIEIQICMEISQNRLKSLTTTFEYFILFKLCQFLVIYDVPNLSVERLDSYKQ